MVSVILDNIADGRTEQQILKSYPALTADGIHAAVRFSAN